MKLKLNELKIGVMLSYASRVVTVVVGLLYTPIMIRLLGQSEYGLYNIAASLISYLGVLNFGFGSAYMRFYSRFKVKDDQKKIATLNGMFLLIFSVLGILAIIAGIIVAFNVDLIFGPSLTGSEIRTAQILMLILVINLGVSFPNIVFDTYIQANEKFIMANGIQLIKQVSVPLINIPILLSGHGSIGMVIGTTTINVVMEIFTMYYAINKMDMNFSFKNFDNSLMKEMTIYSSYIFVNMIIDQINWNMDKTILGRYRGTSSVAIYSIASNLNSYYRQISTTISNVFVPRIHQMVGSDVGDNELTYLFTRVGRVQFVILSLVCSGFIFFGRPFIGFWAGENYLSAYPIGLLLMVPVTIPLIQNMGIEIQRAKNMHQFRTWAYVGMAIVNIILTIPLSQRFGGIGAAIGTSLSLLIGNGLIMNLYNHYKIGLNMGYFWKEILKFIPAFIAPTIFGVIINNMVDLYNIWNFIFMGFVYVIIFMISMWLFGLNNYEKNLVKNPFT